MVNYERENLMLYKDRTIPSRQQKRILEQKAQEAETIRFALKIGNATEVTRRENEQ